MTRRMDPRLREDDTSCHSLAEGNPIYSPRMWKLRMDPRLRGDDKQHVIPLQKGIQFADHLHEAP